MADKLFQGTEHSALYAQFRPVAPPSLIADILDQFPGRVVESCVDVGCGSGQLTQLLVPHSRKITGTDVSSSQLEQARQLVNSPAVDFRLGRGEELSFPDSSVDLVSICQALHWLELEQFYKEVYRVLKHEGILAVIGYSFTGPAPR
jgi:ubiquinone/menaquinone biosynthesis C-methylase UbiE